MAGTAGLNEIGCLLKTFTFLYISYFHIYDGSIIIHIFASITHTSYMR